MKFLLSLLLLIACCSCSNSFINHKLTYEKIGPCSNEIVPVKITSNIAGERYEFFNCLGNDFDGKNYFVERKGDSIVVSFPNTTEPKSSFKLTLDIDAKPAYQHIILDGVDIPLAQQ
jgi:hypothetical protein